MVVNHKEQGRHWIEVEGGMVCLEGPCVVTGQTHRSPPLDRKAVQRFVAERVLAQEAFPELVPAEREFLISGVSPAGWDELMGDLDTLDD